MSSSRFRFNTLSPTVRPQHALFQVAVDDTTLQKRGAFTAGIKSRLAKKAKVEAACTADEAEQEYDRPEYEEKTTSAFAQAAEGKSGKANDLLQANNLGETVDKIVADVDRLGLEIEFLRGEITKIKEGTNTNAMQNRLYELLKKAIAENDKLQKDIIILLERMEKVENDNKALREMVESVNKKNQDLDGEMKSIHELLEAKKRLQLGQIAWELEKKIWDYVLPKQKKGSAAYLKSMKHLLKSGDLSLEEKEEGKRKWEELQRKLKWDEKRHKHALWLLKHIRFDDAHPVVTVEMARKLIKEGSYVAEIEKKSCEEILDMILTLEKL